MCPLPLTRLIPPAGVTPTQLRERLSLAEKLRLPLRVFLFGGEEEQEEEEEVEKEEEQSKSTRAASAAHASSSSHLFLPESLLPMARMLCATTEEDVRVTRAAVDASYRIDDDDDEDDDDDDDDEDDDGEEKEEAAFDWSKAGSSTEMCILATREEEKEEAQLGYTRALLHGQTTGRGR